MFRFLLYFLILVLIFFGIMYFKTVFASVDKPVVNRSYRLPEYVNTIQMLRDFSVFLQIYQTNSGLGSRFAVDDLVKNSVKQRIYILKKQLDVLEKSL